MGGVEVVIWWKNLMKYLDDNPRLSQVVVKTKWNGKKFTSRLEKTRDIPRDESWFETTWNEYENGSWIN